MRRRDLLKDAIALPAALAADVPSHLWQGYDFGSGPPVRGRLNQGPFDIEQDQGWQTVLFTTPSERPVRTPGLGLGGVRMGGERAVAGHTGRSGNVCATRREDFEFAVCGCALHPL